MAQKIYDCFLFSHELELLDLRIKMLGPYVDYFVLLESPWSFHGKPKKKIFEENKEKFNNPKIRHVVYEDLPYIGNVDGKRSRGKKNERHSRNCSLRGISDADPEDIIMLSDVDEIPNMEIVLENLYRIDDNQIHLLDDPTRPYLGLGMPMFYFYLNYITNQPCYTTLISKKKNFKKPSKMRKIRANNKIKNAGWHYSYLGGIKQIRTKLNTIGSTQVSAEKFTNENHIKECLSSGKDLFGRKSVKIKKIDPIKNGPKEISWFIEKYPNLIKE